MKPCFAVAAAFLAFGVVSASPARADDTANEPSAATESPSTPAELPPLDPTAPEERARAAATKRPRSNRVILAGALTFGISYGVSAVIAASRLREGNDAAELFVPVAGPILAIVNIERNVQTCYERKERGACGVMRFGSLFAYPFLAIDTLAQVGGLVLLVVGISSRPSTKSTTRSVTVSPYASGTTFGLTGTF